MIFLTFPLPRLQKSRKMSRPENQKFFVSRHTSFARGDHHAMMEYGTVVDYEDLYILDGIANTSLVAEYTDDVFPITYDADVTYDNQIFTPYNIESDKEHLRCGDYDSTVQSHVPSAEKVTDTVVAYNKAYRTTPEYKAKHAAYMVEYRARPEYKEQKAAYDRAYRACPKYKEKKKKSNKAHRASPEYKEKQREKRAAYNKAYREKNKTKMAEYSKAYRARVDYKQRRGSYRTTPEYKARRAAYDKARRETPEYIARRAAYNLARRSKKNTD